jgi:hypothetical protein
MKKNIVWLFIFALLVSCGDDNSEDFDPTRIEIVTGMNIVTPEGITTEQWGNPNIPTNPNFNIFPKPAFETIRVITPSAIQQIWLVRGVPTQLLSETDFDQVFATTPYQVEDVQANAFRTFEAAGSADVVLQLTGITQGYYRLFIQLQNGSLVWDNIYVQGSSDVNLNDINFWDILSD